MPLYPQEFVDKVADAISSGQFEGSEVGSAAFFAHVSEQGASVHFTGNKVGTLILGIAAIQMVLEEVPPGIRQEVLQKACRAVGFDINPSEKHS